MPNHLFYKNIITRFLCTTHKKSVKPNKILKERTKRLIDLEPFNTIRIKLVIYKAIDEIYLIVSDEMKNLDDIETQIMIKDGKIILKRLWNDLSEFEMTKLEKEINAEIEISKKEEKKIINTIWLYLDCLRKSKPELLDLYTKKKRLFKKKRIRIQKI